MYRVTSKKKSPQSMFRCSAKDRHEDPSTLYGLHSRISTCFALWKHQQHSCRREGREGDERGMKEG